MDFIVSYFLSNEIKKESLEVVKIPNVVKPKVQTLYISNRACEYCGQNPYWCRCSENVKCMYRNFSAEKDNY